MERIQREDARNRFCRYLQPVDGGENRVGRGGRIGRYGLTGRYSFL